MLNKQKGPLNMIKEQKRSLTGLPLWLASLLLVLAAGLAICLFPIRSYAYDEDDYLPPTGNSFFDDFIHDPEHTDDVYWDIHQTPKLTNGGATGCASYCVDFSKYCFDSGALTTSDSYTDPDEIRAGDIVHLTSEKSGHWFAVLKREGNLLYTAEGNWGNYTWICPFYHYEIVEDNVTGSRHKFERGYHFVPEDTGAKAWKHTSGGWRYEDSYGFYLQDSWSRINGKWYYFGHDGNMLTGWQQIGNKWYYFTGSGAMQTDWKKIGKKWYYFGKNGVMAKGWKLIDGSWYYFAGGAMVNGWKKLSGNWYYFSGGAMITGWKCIGGIWYFFNEDGEMQSGWLEDGGKIYYLNDGAMVIGTFTIDGVEYTFLKDGSLDDSFYIAG